MNFLLLLFLLKSLDNAHGWSEKIEDELTPVIHHGYTNLNAIENGNQGFLKDGFSEIGRYGATGIPETNSMDQGHGLRILKRSLRDERFKTKGKSQSDSEKNLSPQQSNLGQEKTEAADSSALPDEIGNEGLEFQNVVGATQAIINAPPRKCPPGKRRDRPTGRCRVVFTK